MIVNPFRTAKYTLGAARLEQLPEDAGIEVAFAGRSNAGKSSALNTLTDQKSLARTSKTPGRTQLINVFDLDEDRRLIDLPGYGFAQVSLEVKQRWQKTLSLYLESRRCLQGLVVLMDIRHPLKESDKQMLLWSSQADIPTHVLLSKADKLKSGAQKQALMAAKKQLERISSEISVQTFSSLKKQGVEPLLAKLKVWYGYPSE